MIWFFSGEKNGKQNNLRNVTTLQFALSLIQKEKKMLTEYFHTDITITTAQHAESRQVQTKLKTEENKASPKTNNGTWETHPCQISIDEKTNSKNNTAKIKTNGTPRSHLLKLKCKKGGFWYGHFPSLDSWLFLRQLDGT